MSLWVMVLSFRFQLLIQIRFRNETRGRVEIRLLDKFFLSSCLAFFILGIIKFCKINKTMDEYASIIKASSIYLHDGEEKAEDYLHGKYPEYDRLINITATTTL